MVAIINGWRMWGEPAPSVCRPPVVEPERDSEPTHCGYAPIADPAAAVPVVAVPKPEITPLPPPREIPRRGFHWAQIRVRSETVYEFRGAVTDPSELTFMGKLIEPTPDDRWTWT